MLGMKIGRENVVMQLQFHNGKALEFLIAEHGERLISIVRKHLFTLPHLQQECLEHTIMAIWDHIDSFDTHNEFENWIGSVARYHCLEFLKTYQKEATIAWLIEKEIAEEKEMMVSFLNPQEQELFYRFYVGEDLGKAAKKEIGLPYEDIYDLLNQIDTDIFEYEKEHMSKEEKAHLFHKLEERLNGKRRRFSLKRYFGHSFRKAAPMNC